MTALAASGLSKGFAAKSLTLAAATNQQTYKNGLACFDTSTGLVTKGAVSATLIPIGLYSEDKLTEASNATVTVELFREIQCKWFVNATAGDAVVAANVGGLGYVLDDQTVANNDSTNTRSVLGRIWKLDSTRGVLVEPLQTSSAHVSGLDI